MIILVFYKGVECAVDCVILARFYLNRNHRKAFVVVDEIIHLALIPVVVIEQLMTVSYKLTRHDAFVYRAEVYASFVV